MRRLRSRKLPRIRRSAAVIADRGFRSVVRAVRIVIIDVICKAVRTGSRNLFRVKIAAAVQAVDILLSGGGTGSRYGRTSFDVGMGTCLCGSRLTEDNVAVYRNITGYIRKTSIRILQLPGYTARERPERKVPVGIAFLRPAVGVDKRGFINIRRIRIIRISQYRMVVCQKILYIERTCSLIDPVSQTSVCQVFL